MNKIKLISATVIMLFISLSLFAGKTKTYTFNNLTPGALNGQDNWQSWSVWYGNGGTFNVSNGYGPNNANSVYCTNGNLTNASRANNANFRFPRLRGNETSTEFSFYVLALGWGIEVGLGYDDDGNGRIDAYNYSGHTKEIGFSVLINTYADYCGLIDAAGNFHQAAYGDMIPTFGNVYEYKVVFNFQANNGQGSATLYKRNVTNNENTFTLIPSLQNININLDKSLNNNHKNPRLWNSIYLHGDSDINYVNNITLKR